MNEAQLLALFRRSLRASVSVPVMLGAFACGGRTDDVVSDPFGDASSDAPRVDAGKPDAAKPEASSCEPIPCGPCAAGCTPLRYCIGSVAECTCDCIGQADASMPPPPPTDCHPAAPSCGATVDVPTSCFSIVPNDGGALSPEQCSSFCPAPTFGGMVYSCLLVPDGAGSAAVACTAQCAVNGRAFAGLPRRSFAAAPSPLAAYFAEAAYLEAASVASFEILRRELLAHDAPAALVADAERAAADEVRHARITGKLALRYGETPVMPRAEARPVRPLFDLALENAVEGCVRETYAALLAHHQAHAAKDARVRLAMQVIAPDETRHAALAWGVAAWADERLTEAERATVREAQRAAVAELRAEARREPAAELVLEAGVPTTTQAARLIDSLSSSLWSLS